MVTPSDSGRARYVSTQAFVRQVTDFSRALDDRRELVARYLAMAGLRAPPEPAAFGGALEMIDEQHEELAVAREELHAQLEALEEAVAGSERERRRYRALFDATPDALLAVDRAGVVEAANRAAAALFGVDAAALRGRELTSFVAPSDGARVRAMLHADGGAADVTLADARGATFGGRMTCSPIEAAHALVVVKRADAAAGLERALRETREQLERERIARARLEDVDRAKDRFIGVLSHDLRSPINAVLGWTRMLRKEQLPRDARLRALETIERSARQQVALVEELLDVSRIAADKVSLDLRTLDLRACVRQVAEGMIPNALDAGVHLTTTFPDDAVPVFADRVRLLQIVSNLVSNAIKFTPGGGHIHVRVTRDGARAVLAVEDDGRGIEDAALPHLFEPYRQGMDVGAARSGLGLGLYIVRRLVELQSGSVEVASRGRNRGARFTVRLPLVPESTGQDSTALLAADESGVDLASLHVLVVDDDADARELLAVVLANYGATVAVAADGAEALAVFETCAPDIVVSDLEMPASDGFALIARIRARAPGVPAIAVSALAGHADAERALAAGYDAHLSKPVDVSELVERVSDLAARARR